MRDQTNDIPRAGDVTAPPTKSEEIRTFLFMMFIAAPILAVAVVGGYGFFVWMYQLVTGELPGPY